jgi:hypothetical protein
VQSETHAVLCVLCRALLCYSERMPRKIYFSMNKRDASTFDLYTLDLDTLEMGLYAVNPGDVSSWLVDFDFKLRVSLGGL